jgi:hypothetical protein
MSEFAAAESSTSPVKKSWADSESDSDNDEVKNSSRNGIELEQTNLQPVDKSHVADEAMDGNDDDENESTSSSEEEEEDDDSDQEDNGSYKLSAIPAASAVSQSKPKAVQNLSKKEKLEQRQKELDDLDAILSQFKIEEPNDAGSVSNEQDPNGSSNVFAEVDEKAKKKRKKKASTYSVSSNPPPTSNEEAPQLSQDVSKILKSRTAKTKKTVVSDAQKVAIAEAMKKDSNKKKKKDKSKFSEGSY